MTATPPFTPATTLDDAVRALHEAPLESDDPRYEDFAAARGDDPTRVLKGKLVACERDNRVCAAFLSHRGAGKTTELKRLAADLKHHFEIYHFEANLRLDPQNLTTEDLLLALAFGVDAHFEVIGRPLPAARIDAVHKWFAEIVTQTQWGRAVSGELKGEAGVGGDVKFLKLQAELQGVLRTESEYRTEVRDAFRRYPNRLVESVNTILDAAQTRLDEEGEERRLLIIIDNLDRYEPEVVDRLLVQRNLLRDLRVSLVVTPPIALYYKPIGEPLSHHFECEVMNTIKLREPHQPYGEFAEDRRGRDLMLEALSKRLDLDKLIPDEQARDRLVSASGGAIRDLLRLTRETIFRARGKTLDLRAVEGAVSKVRSEFRDRINANDWAPTLGRIAVEKQIHAGCMMVLYQRLALKYNGDGWYDVHPLVAEIDEVRQAIDAVKAARAAKKETPGE